MAFDDFLRQNYPQLGGNLTATPVPGMTAPVQFTPMPNTAPGDAAAAQVQANDQAVLAQQAQDQATARAQQIVAASRERIGAQEDRGGGFLQPLRNVVNTVVDYPSTLRGAVENIIDNPTSIGAWGGAAMQAASPAFALADIPNQYWKEARGEILYRAASGDEQFFDILGMFIPGGSVTLSGIYMGLDAGLDDSTKQKIMTAHDEGYNGFTGGTAVYEAAIGLTDDWHPVAKYSFRIVNEVVNDPTTWIGVGAAAQARQVGKLGQIGRSADDFAALSRTGKVGAIVEDIKTTRDPLLAADAALRGINYVPDQVMFGPFGYAGRKLRERDGGAGNWLFRRSEGDLRRTVEAQENQTLADFARATEPTTMPVDPPMTVVEGGQTLPSTEMGEPVRGTYLLPSGPNEAPDPLPGFDATIDVRPERKVRIRYTYREQATGDAGFVDVMEDGTIRVLPPRQQDWIGVSTIEEGLDQIAMTVPNPPATQRSPVGPNPTYEQQQRYAAQGNIPQHMRPQRDISVKPMTDGTTTVYQVHHETRGDLYIRKQPNGYYRVNDDKGVMVPGPEYANYNDAYEAATTYLLQQPYKFQADPYGRPLHPSTAPNPEGNRIIDEAYRLTQENPGDQNWQWFWQRFRNVNDAYAPVLDQEQAFIDANNPGLRRDLAQGDPELVERNRTVDTATKTLAEANIAFYADYLSSIVNGGERVFTSRRGWNGSPSEQIATFLYGEPTARSRIFRKDINDADAIREAMLTDSNEAARLVIDWFRTKRKVMLSVKQANSVLLPGAQMRPGSTSRDGYVNLANVLEANRSRRREMLRNPETVPMAALPMGEITPPRQVPRVERIERPSANLGMSQPLDEDVLLGELATGEMPGRNPRSGQQTPLPPNPDEIHEAVWNRWRETPTDDRRYDGVMEARKKATDAMAIVTDKRARVNQAQRERAWTTAQFYLSEEERLLHPLEGTVGPMPPPTTTATREVFIPPAAPRIDSPQPQAVEPLGMSTPTDFTVPSEPVIQPATVEPLGMSTPTTLPRETPPTTGRDVEVGRRVEVVKPGRLDFGQRGRVISQNKGWFVVQWDGSIGTSNIPRNALKVTEEEGVGSVGGQAFAAAREQAPSPVDAGPPPTHRVEDTWTGKVVKKGDTYRAEIRDKDGTGRSFIVYGSDRFPTREEAQRNLDEAMAGRPSWSAPTNRMSFIPGSRAGAADEPLTADQEEIQGALRGLTEPEPEAALPSAPENKDLPKLKDLPDVEDHEGIVRMEMRVLARENQADFATFKQVIDRMGGLGDAATTRQWRLATNILKKLPPEFISPYRYMEMARVGRRLNERTRTLRASKNQAERRQLWGEVQRLQREYDELANAPDDQVFDITERLRTAPETTPAAATPTPEAPATGPQLSEADFTWREIGDQIGVEKSGFAPDPRPINPEGEANVLWNGWESNWRGRVETRRGGTNLWDGPRRKTREEALADLNAYLRGETPEGGSRSVTLEGVIPDGEYQVWRNDGRLLGIERTPEKAEELRWIHDQKNTGDVRIVGPGETPPRLGEPLPPALPEAQPPLATGAQRFTPTLDEPTPPLAPETPLTPQQRAAQTRRINRASAVPGMATDAAPFTPTEMPEPLPGRAVPGRYEQITEEVPIPREDLPPLPEDKWTLPEGVTVDDPQAILPWDIRPSRVEMADVPNAANPPDITLAADTPLVKRVRVRPPGSPNRPEELWSQVVTGDQDESSAALDTLVYDLTGGNVQRDVPEATATLEVDEAISGFGTYTVRDEADGIPAVQITREGDKLIVIAPGGSEDPMVKNIIARAGDGVPVEVRAGLGDAVGKPMGLDGPMTNGVPDPLWDPVYRLHRMAKIDDTEREMLEEIIQISEGKTPKTMRVADFYLYNRSQSESMDEAIRKTMAVFRKHRNAARRAGKEEAGDYDGKLRKLLRLYDTMTDWIRERLMFNPYTGGVSAMLDHVGDTARMLSMGEFGAARKSWRRESLKGGIKSAQGDNSYLLNSDAAKIYSGLEVDIPIETAPNVGREGVDRHRGMSWDKFLAKHVPDAKSQRTFKRALAATGMRGSDFMMELRSGGDIARRVALSGEEIARQLPKFREDFFKEVDAVARRRPDFNAEQFKADLGEVFGPSSVREKAMANGLDSGQAEHLMREWKAQHRPLQELGLKRAGEVLFTYQQTNADQLLRRVFLFHYWYTRASVAYTRTILRNPYLYANYMRMTEGMEKMAEDQPNSVKGMIKAFTGPGGYAIFMDPLKAVSTAATFRREAFQNGDETEFDKFLDTTGLFLNPMLAAASAVVGATSNERVDPLATFQLRRVGGAALNMINAETGVLGGKYLGTPFQDKMGKAVEELSDLFGETNQYRDSAATDKVLIRTNIMDRVMARHNIESGTEFGLWPAQAMAELQEAYDAFDQGRPNPDADGAYREWARGNLVKTAASLVAPVTTSMRSDTKDARSTMARAGSRGAGQELDIINAAPEATDLTMQDARFDSLFPSNEAGRMFTSPLTGQTQGEVLEQPGMEAYNEYREWRNAARDMGAMAFRERMRRISPSYADYLSRQESEMGDIFREDPDYYDNISTSYQAYLAAQGERASAYDPSPLPSVDMSRVDASTFVTGGIGGTPAVTKPENLASQITGQLIGYQQQQAEFNRLVQQYFGQEVVFDLLSPQGQALIRQQLGPMGIRIPSLGEAAAGYQAWSRVQPVGSDTSIDAYVRWLENRAATGQSTRAVPMMAAM